MDKLCEPPLQEHLQLFRKFSVDLLQEADPDSVGSVSRKRGVSREDCRLGFRDDNQNKRRRLVTDESEAIASYQGSDLEEVFGEEGLAGTVERFLSNKTGEILVVKDNRSLKVLFHADQVMTGGDWGHTAY